MSLFTMILEEGVENSAADGGSGAEQHGLPSGSQPWDCQELLLFAYLNVPFQPALSVETAIFCLIVSLAEVTHRLLTHSLLL